MEYMLVEGTIHVMADMMVWSKNMEKVKSSTRVANMIFDLLYERKGEAYQAKMSHVSSALVVDHKQSNYHLAKAIPLFYVVFYPMCQLANLSFYTLPIFQLLAKMDTAMEELTSISLTL